MVPYITDFEFAHSDKVLRIGDVVGGRLGGDVSKIDAYRFKKVLIQALSEAGIFRLSKSNDIPDYVLKTFILTQKQPAMGLDMTVELYVTYTILDGSTREELWSKDVVSKYTASFFSACIGASRVNKANEGAVRENIKSLLLELSRYTENVEG